MSYIKKPLLRVRMFMLSMAVMLLSGLGLNAVSAHEGHHHGEGWLVEIFHWFVEPDHLMVLAVVALGLFLGSRAVGVTKR